LASTWQINVIDDPNGWIAGHYAITAIPHLFIIGRNGKVLANHVGYGDRSIDDLVTDINKALSEATPTEPEESRPATVPIERSDGVPRNVALTSYLRRGTPGIGTVYACSVSCAEFSPNVASKFPE